MSIKEHRMDYQIGDIVFRYSRNKTNVSPNNDLSNPNDHLEPEYAKIFFVCREDGVLNKNPFELLSYLLKLKFYKNMMLFY